MPAGADRRIEYGPLPESIPLEDLQSTARSRTEKKLKNGYVVRSIDALCYHCFRSWSMQQCKLPVLQQTRGLLFPAMPLRLWNKMSVLSRGDVRVQWTNVQKLLSAQERDLWNACKLHALPPSKLCRYVFFRLETIMVMMCEVVTMTRTTTLSMMIREASHFATGKFRH